MGIQKSRASIRNICVVILRWVFELDNESIGELILTPSLKT